MLRHLHIENYAIIEHLDIEFAPSLNIVTGQTGAGKSILLGALGLLGGARADASSIGPDAQSCIVEGCFLVDGYDLEGIFSQQDLDYEPTIHIRRIISRSGKSRAFVGDVPVSLQTLRAICDRLIDIHSQHQTLLLTRGDFQRQIVDVVADNASLLDDYQELYGQMSELRRQIAELKKAKSDGSKISDYLTYQIDELHRASIGFGEQLKLEAEQRQLANAGEILSTLGLVGELLDSEQGGVVGAVRQSTAALSRIEGSLDLAGGLAERLESCYIELKDIASDIESATERVESDPRQLERVELRLDKIYTLCKKHNVDSGDQLSSLLSQFEAQLAAISSGEELIGQKEQLLSEVSGSAQLLSDRLHQARSAVIARIESQIIASLTRLGIAHPQFVIDLAPSGELAAHGADNVRFLFSANERSVAREIEGVASGGEISRLMLCIKDLVAARLKMPTVIFDEIDTGVSGAVADAMGDIIEAMGQRGQVINITHLPQVASKGSNHYKVYKSPQGTHICRLTAQERVTEIAAMLSGAAITDAAIAQAETLLNTQSKTKKL